MKVKTKTGDDINLEFTDTFFESFEGTPEKLKEIMEMIINQVQDGSLFEEAEPVGAEELTEDEIETWKNNSKRNIQ